MTMLPSHAEREGASPTLPGYTEWTLLGAGGFARVYAAKRDVDGRHVAVKIALRRADPRFVQEAAALRRLGPPVAPALIEDCSAAAPLPYVVMERIEGAPLSQWLAAGRGRPLEDSIALVVELANVVDAMHQAGIVHRDLKPDNILVCGGDEVASGSSRKPSIRLVDFGLALLATSPAAEEPDAAPGQAEITAEGAQLGTILYMSPEQCNGRRTDARTDIYSLGVILFEALVGRRPFEGEAATVTQAHASRRPPIPSRLAGTPAELDEVVLRCLAKAADDRYPRARDLAEALERALARVLASMPEPRLSGPFPPPAPDPSVTARPALRGAARTDVVLLALRTRAPASELLRAGHITAEAKVARVLEDGIVLAFTSPRSLGLTIQAALYAAARLVALAEDIVIHVAPVVVRERPSGTIFLGSALDASSGWAERRGARGVALTPAAATALAADTSASSVNTEAPSTRSGMSSINPPSSRRIEIVLDEIMPTASIQGRDDLLATLTAEAMRCLAEGRPGLSTITGEVGHGKSRLAEDLAARIGVSFDATFVLKAPPSEHNEGEQLVRALARVALSLPDGALDAEAIRAACVARLGAAAESLWAVVACALGAVSETDPVLAHAMSAPGALRRALSRALGMALAARAVEAPTALVIDDAHYADPAVLDAIEIGTLSGQTGALWIVVAAQPTLLAQRPLWGDRAAQHCAHELGPLGDGPARQVLRELLKPVEFIPDPVIERLREVTGGVPLHLVEVARALRANGRVRRRSDTGECYLAADELLQRSTTPLAERLARQSIDRMPEPLLDVLRITAVLGVEVKVSDVTAVQLAAEAGAAPVMREAMDPGVGLARLSQQGLLLPAGEGRYRFRHAMLHDAIEATISPSLRQRLHDAALRHLEGLGDRRAELLPRIARHAAASGAEEKAALAHLELADGAACQHRHIEAESHYTSALALLAPGQSGAREQILSGRGQSRAFLERYAEALADLQEARALAVGRGDDQKVANLLLDEATLYDLHTDWAASAQAVEQAAPLVELLAAPRLAARLASARGRTHWRHGRTRAGVEELGRGADMAARLGDVRTQCESLLLLSTALIADGRIAEAAQRFEEVTDLCERSGDRFHLAMAHINRIWLWIKLQDHERAIADQRVALTVARELGNATLEAFAGANMAEILYFSGAYLEALPLARRTDQLLRRVHPQTAWPVVFIRARLEAVLGHVEDARALIAPLKEEPTEELSPFFRAMMRTIDMLASDPRADDELAWSTLIQDLASCAETDEGIDALYHAAERSLRAGRREHAERWIREALAQSHGQMWRRRFEALAAQLPS